MKDNNSCKFPLSKTSSELSISCFVLESNTETMLIRTKLNDNRMILITQGEGEFLFA